MQQKRKQEQMGSLKDFLQWYNNKDVVPTLEALQKMIASYHDKDIDMLKLGCFVPNLANICLHKSTDANFYPFTEADKELLQKFEMWLVVYQSLSHAKQLLMKLLFENLETYANIMFGLMSANYIPTQCVNPCLPVFMRVGISIQKQVN